MSQKPKRFFSRLFSPYKRSDKSLDPIIVSNNKKRILKKVRIFLNVRKNDQKQFHIFGNDFSVKNIKKKVFFKKTYFVIFLVLLCFHEKQTNWLQNWPELTKTCIYVILK